MKNRVEFIKNAGGCITLKNILEGKGNIKWLFKEKPVNKINPIY